MRVIPQNATLVGQIEQPSGLAADPKVGAKARVDLPTPPVSRPGVPQAIPGMGSTVAMTRNVARSLALVKAAALAPRVEIVQYRLQVDFAGGSLG